MKDHNPKTNITTTITTDTLLIESIIKYHFTELKQNITNQNIKRNECSLINEININ